MHRRDRGSTYVSADVHQLVRQCRLLLEREGGRGGEDHANMAGETGKEELQKNLIVDRSVPFQALKVTKELRRGAIAQLLLRQQLTNSAAGRGRETSRQLLLQLRVRVRVRWGE